MAKEPRSTKDDVLKQIEADRKRLEQQFAPIVKGLHESGALKAAIKMAQSVKWPAMDAVAKAAEAFSANTRLISDAQRAFAGAMAGTTGGVAKAALEQSCAPAKMLAELTANSKLITDSHRAITDAAAGITGDLAKAALEHSSAPTKMLAELTASTRLMGDPQRALAEAMSSGAALRLSQDNLVKEFSRVAESMRAGTILASAVNGVGSISALNSYAQEQRDLLWQLSDWPQAKASFFEQLPELERWAAQTRGAMPKPLQDLVDRALEPVDDEEAATAKLDELATQADAVIQTGDTPDVREQLKTFSTLTVLMYIGRFLAEQAAGEALKKSPEAMELLLLTLLSVFSPVGTLPSPSPPAALVLPAAPGAPNIQTWQATGLPEIIKRAGPQAQKRTIEFFTAEIRNPNTRQAYMRAVSKFFAWTEERELDLADITPFVVAAYIEELQHDASAPTVKQHLAAIRMLFDYLVVGQVIPMNPAASVRGPKHVVKRGKTPVLSADQARELLASIDTSDIIGLRDRALIGVMVYSFARVSATVGMRVGDYYPTGKRWWIRLHEKGGKHHEVPAHHNAEAFLDAYIEAAGIGDQKRGPLFRTMGRNRQLSHNPMSRVDALRMVYRRSKRAGLDTHVCCHTFRATGITAYLENGGTIEKAQQIAAHESPRTTKLYDRTNDELTLDEIERIRI